ncbi:MAG: metallophosphoesterase family protein [Planctomycetota bacterium]
MPPCLGLISDTHGLLRPEAIAALKGCEQILHAGDVGGPEILEALEAIAPVTAIRGNNDRAAWAEDLPLRADVIWQGVRILVVHDVKDLAGEDIEADVVVSGHSHRPAIEARSGILYVNPGSAGPRRFRLPISIARLSMTARGPRARLKTLELGEAARS